MLQYDDALGSILTVMLCAEDTSLNASFTISSFNLFSSLQCNSKHKKDNVIANLQSGNTTHNVAINEVTNATLHIWKFLNDVFEGGVIKSVSFPYQR